VFRSKILFIKHVRGGMEDKNNFKNVAEVKIRRCDVHFS